MQPHAAEERRTLSDMSCTKRKEGRAPRGPLQSLHGQIWKSVTKSRLMPVPSGGDMGAAPCQLPGMEEGQ
eukprot:scaffold90563_cov15-Tisochrysis_lutea.AAC.1